MVNDPGTEQEVSRIEPVEAGPSVRLGALMGAVLGIPWLGLLAVGQGLVDLPNPAFSAFELATRLLPGGVVTFGLEILIGSLQSLRLGSTSELGKAAEALMAYAGGVVVTSLLGGAFAAWKRRGARPASLPTLAVGLGLGLAASLLAAWSGWGRAGAAAGLIWLFGLGLAWARMVERASRHVERGLEAAPDQARRIAVGRVAAMALAVGAAAFGLARVFRRGAEEGAEPAGAFAPQPTPAPPPFRQGFTPVGGTRPEISPLDEFYRVDINLMPPSPQQVAEAARRQAQGMPAEADLPSDEPILGIAGHVDRPQLVTLEAIRALPASEAFVTLECISNRVGGDLIDTSLFTGARLADVLDMAGLQPGAVDIRFTCADGYTESLPLESALDERTLLCYAMGGRALTPEHGFPFRLYTPNRFGMKNPKWIVLLEAVDFDYRGYWEQRGWSEEAFVKTTSVIDAVSEQAEGAIEAGGIAFAGERGIQQVEVRLDEGAWIAAELNRPLSPLTWVLWRARVRAEPGTYTLFVRATDGNGQVQTAQRTDTYPSGASGYHRRSVDVPG